MSKKARGPNFSSNEKEMLIHLVTKHKEIVENKKTDAVTTTTKNEGWRKLTEEFNSLSSFCIRSTEQLKTCWDNIKRCTRKDKATTKKEMMLTGGGRPNFPPPGALHNQVESLLGPTLDGLENPFDSDAKFAQYNVTNSDPLFIEESLDAVEVINTNDDLNLGCAILPEKVSADVPVMCKFANNECAKAVPENALAGPSGTSKLDDACSITLQNKENTVWNGWTPAALKTKVSDRLLNKKSSPAWLQRRRPKASLHDKLLESKIELVDIMKKNLESEAKYKELLFEEQMKQEKIKTRILELQLKEKRDD